MIGKSVYKLIAPIIALINTEILVKSITDNGNGTYTLLSSDTGYATKGFTVTINLVDYKIESINYNVSIIVSGASLPVTSVVNLYAPKFYHGTVIVTNSELNKQALSWDKLPMIWLHEVATEEIDLQGIELTSKKVSCELYFMIDADHANWTNDNQYDLAIAPMRNLADRFLQALERSSFINWNEINKVTISDRPKWGVYIGEKGNVQKIFADNLSGLKMEIDLPFIISCE